MANRGGRPAAPLTHAFPLVGPLRKRPRLGRPRTIEMVPAVVAQTPSGGIVLGGSASSSTIVAPSSYSDPYPDAGNSNHGQSSTDIAAGDVFVLVAGAPAGDVPDFDSAITFGSEQIDLVFQESGAVVNVAVYAGTLATDHPAGDAIAVNGPGSMSWITTFVTPADGTPVWNVAAVDGDSPATVDTGRTDQCIWVTGMIGDGEPPIDRDPVPGVYLHDIGGVPWDASVGWSGGETSGQSTTWSNSGRIGLALVALPVSTAGSSISKTPSGGLVLGGSSARTATKAKTPTGGGVLGGSVARAETKAGTVSGGLVLGGSAARTATKAATPSSGLVLGGSAARTETKAPSPTGGLVLGGSTARTETKAPSASGGVVLGGGAPYERVLQPGGIVLGGSTSRTATKASSVSGGVVLGGSVSGGRTLAFATAGGIALGGTASRSSAKAPAPSGGVTLGGSASTTATKARAPSGGVVLAGAAVFSTGNVVVGGLVLGGTRSMSAATAASTSGGAVLGGSSSMTRPVSRSAGGGIALGGAASSTRAFAATVTGGVALGGSANSSAASGAAYFPSGGLALGGSTSLTKATPLTPAGGLALGGTTTAGRSIAIATVTGGIALGASIVVIPPVRPGVIRIVTSPAGLARVRDRLAGAPVS